MTTASEIQTASNVSVRPEIDFLETPFNQAIKETPGMISVDERRLLYFLSKDKFRGSGAIIDGGSFLGASAVSIAQGLLDKDNAQEISLNKIIKAYELGVFPAPANGREIWHEYGDVRFKRGDSFLPALRKNISPYEKLISLREGDLGSYSWDGGEIELCFIDVCKTAELNRHVTSQFFPCLMPANSYMINQDYFFDRLPWIKVTMGYLAEYFEWLGQVHCSSVYKCVKEIPQAVADYDPYTEASLEECLKLHDMGANHEMSEMYKLRMEISKAYLMAYKGEKERALKQLEHTSTLFGHTMSDDADRGEMNRFRFERALRQITIGRM
ncbi:hypothetical protein [Pseudovibrio sp. SPO723]|uniref:hypothetical protein n=1 Tax=Nesiotobacter zosterae TaxID=392721 RepID=UPI0029C39DE4|nr:hypothetical protein [Pseudovibrio sp. SPO723]MDX5594292.1 hypothetical protein [Pseudovibrio sp. SPO723]